MPTSSSRPLARGEKRLIVGVPTLLLLVAGVAVLLARINAPAVIPFPASAPLPNPNGFDVYVAAAKSIRIANPDVDSVTDTRDLRHRNPKLAAQNFSLARRMAWLHANAAGFALFGQARALPCVYPASQLPRGNLNDSKLRLLARNTIVEANTLKLRGDWNGAVTAALDIVQMGSDTGNGAPIIGRLVSDSIIALGLWPLTTSDDPVSRLNLAQSRAATRRLEAVLQRRSSLKAIWENQRWRTLTEFDQMRHQPGFLRQFRSGSMPFAEKWKTYVIPQAQIVADINRNIDEQIADAQHPFSAPLKLTKTDDPIAEPFTFKMSGRPQEARSLTSVRVMLLRLALHTYQLENGAFPANLSQLAPKYLAKVPTDIYADNAPFHYTNKVKTYLLYSVGPDGKDDGGAPIPWRNGKSGPIEGYFPSLGLDSKGDYVAGPIANR